MEIDSYNLLYDNIHDFKKTAALVESEIKRLNIESNNLNPVPGTGRLHQNMWESMKTVSHFNIATALELMLKLLLFLNNKKIDREHRLALLYKALPSKCRRQLEGIFKESNKTYPENRIIVLKNTDSETEQPIRPQEKDISTLEKMFEYFDEDVLLWQKRYSWEFIEKKRWRHYISNISVFIELINRVMSKIKRY